MLVVLLEMPLVPDQILYLAPLHLPVAVAAVLHQAQTVMAAMAGLVVERLAQLRISEEQVTRQALVRRREQMAGLVVAHRDMAQAVVVALRQPVAMVLAQRAVTAVQARHLASLVLL